MQNSTPPRFRDVSRSRIAGRAGLAIATAVTAILIAAPAASAEGGFGPAADVTVSDDTGKVDFVGTDPGNPIPAPAGIDADSSAA